MAEKGDMKSWEFLLQKEGDRTWLPLENQTVEILEGRYRVVARTPCAQEEVDIYVSFVSSEDDPPKRRIQQRSHAANDDGLLAILPFTPFRPGHWELRCRPHEASGGLSRPWQGQIQLQVLPQDDMAGEGDLFGWDQPQDDALESQVTTSDPSERVDSGESGFGELGSGKLDRGLLDDTPDLKTATTRDEQSYVEAAARLDAESERAEMPMADLESGHQAASAAELDPATTSDEDIQRLAAEMSQMVMESVTEADLAVSEAAEVNGAAADSPAASAEIAAQPENLDFVADSRSTLPSAPGVVSDVRSGGQIDPEVIMGPEEKPSLASPMVTIALEETVVMMERDRQVTVRGQITQVADVGSNPSDSDDSATIDLNAQPIGTLLPAELVLTTELRDPSTTEVWASQRESFHQAIAPVSFVSQLRLPAACRIQLFLGNATLWQVQASGELKRLVSQDFNAMATVDELLEHAYPPEQVSSQVVEDGTVSNLKQQAASNFLVTKFGAKPQIAKGNVQINTELLSLLKPTSASAETQVAHSRARPASGESGDTVQAAGRESHSRLELPSFANRRPLSIPQADRLANALADDSMDLTNDAMMHGGGNGETGGLFDFQGEQSSVAELQGEPLQGEPFQGETLDAEVVVNSGEALADLDALSDAMAFEAVGNTAENHASNNLDSRETNPFALPLDGSLVGLEGLQGDEDARPPSPTLGRSGLDVAGEGDLTDALGRAPALEADDLARMPEGSALDLRSETAITNQVGAADLGSDGGFDHEVVVDDEELVIPNKLDWMKPSPTESWVDEELVVANPELTVPEKVLVRGETLRIQVRVAQEPARLCARVWLLDCQSRTLLGEPKWITAFLPLGEEWMEANVDLVVPEGSIELQIEAIAVEPITKRESRKVSVRRAVSLEADDQASENW